MRPISVADVGFSRRIVVEAAAPLGALVEELRRSAGGTALRGSRVDDVRGRRRGSAGGTGG